METSNGTCCKALYQCQCHGIIITSPEQNSSELMTWHGVRPSVCQLFTFSNSSQERLKGSTPNLAQIFLMSPNQVLLLYKLIRNPI